MHVSSYYHQAIKQKKNIFLCILVLLLIFLFFWTRPNLTQTGTIKIWDRNNILLYESAGSVGKKMPVGFDAFPASLINATIASEDETFWTNPGIDLQAIFRSTFLDIQQRKLVSGASTITQQLARISINSRQSYSRSFVRKIREVLMALRINGTHSKKEILTDYLNQTYYGNLAYGAEAASRVYFNKDVRTLSLAESAFLAGLVSSPDARNPFSNFSAAKRKQLQILDLMVKNKFISKTTEIQAEKERITLVSSDNGVKAPHFVQYVLQSLSALPLNSKAGMNIYTTLDYPTYQVSQEIATQWVNRLKDQHDLSNASLVLLDNSSGAIIDMLGGINYFDAKNDGEVNMTVALRQPGSALKPVTYATAFMQGYTPATLIYDVAKVYKTKKGEGYTPNNYDGQYHGMVLAREALASSLNLPAVEMLSRVGIPNFLTTAKKLGITTLNQDDRYDLSLTLGGGEVKLLDLTNVFAGFARGGLYKTPYAIEKVTNDDGGTLYVHRIESGVQSLGKNGLQVSYLISDILSDPKARVLGFYEKNPLVLSRPAAVKTGTTTDWHDNWTVGYTPSYTVGVWVGNNDNHAMKDITGVVGAAPIWHQFFEEFLKGKQAEQFVKPGNIKEVTVCKIDGLLPGSLCPNTLDEEFISGTEPKQPTHLYKQVTVDTRNNLLASISCPAEFTTKKVFISYPPEVYSWAVANNQDVVPTTYSPFCTQGSDTIGKSFIQITYPRAKTIFENAPQLVTNQGIVFVANVSENIIAVRWSVDGKPFLTTQTVPFSASWYPAVGKHTVQAEGMTENSGSIKSDTIPFSVILYNGND